MTDAPAIDAASWGQRTGSALIDLTIMVTILVVGIIAGAILAATGGWRVAIGVAIIVAGVIGSILYAPLMVSRSGDANGLTLGKQAVGVRAVRDDGQPIGFWLGMLREWVVPILIGILITGGLFWLVDLLWPLFDNRNRAVHDIVAATHVTNLQA